MNRLIISIIVALSALTIAGVLQQVIKGQRKMILNKQIIKKFKIYPNEPQKYGWHFWGESKNLGERKTVEKVKQQVLSSF
ncbi:hypothetical protein ACQKKK_00895 [Peribacillus sp. NPDC006672]|uniref:hypothetical protein n=1 Tax=Peribacillus sp. NPDC006672 TaxID=3390606 RepID=UPI003CFC418F